MLVCTKVLAMQADDVNGGLCLVCSVSALACNVRGSHSKTLRKICKTFSEKAEREREEELEGEKSESMYGLNNAAK